MRVQRLLYNSFPTRLATVAKFMPHLFSALESFNIFLFTFLAPSAPPVNVTAYNLSSTSVMVTWFPVPDDMLNGILQSYRVVYRKASSVNSAQLEMEVANTSLSVIISSLKKFTVYSVWVKAVTVAEGPSSAVVNVSTDEDGKVVLFIITFFLFEDLKPSLCE